MQNKNKLMLLLRYCFIVTCSCFLFSCNTTKRISRENYVYFQNGLDSIKNIQLKQPVIQKSDLLSIQVTSASMNQEQTTPFNLPASSGGSGNGYLVNMSGNVEMPVVGNVKAEGLTPLQLQTAVTEKLSQYVKDPIVLVHFLSFKINLLGEVKSPGTKTFTSDRVTLIDAVSAAGDLTDFGKREDVTVIREEGNVRRIYKVDMRGGGLFQSPAYILQSNDIVYVGPIDQKFTQLRVAASNTNNVRQGLQIFSTLLGLVTTIVVIIKGGL
ncbi:MAG: polysaccharide biosynthesis/export family protein [Ferruginibacter sp.]